MERKKHNKLSIELSYYIVSTRQLLRTPYQVFLLLVYPLDYYPYYSTNRQDSTEEASVYG